jgi:hypothetical protein
MSRTESPTRTATANDPQYWRDRAVKMRAAVVTMKGSDAHILMNDFADDYDTLADDKERQASAKHGLK